MKRRACGGNAQVHKFVSGVVYIVAVLMLMYVRNMEFG